jgi:hypothetical protein
VVGGVGAVSGRDTDRDALVVRLIDNDGRTATYVAAQLGITRQRVQQLYRRMTGRGVLDLLRAGRPARLMALVHEEPSGCWTWTGALRNGYGDTCVDGERYAHRWSYEHFVGPIPDGLTIDHLCRNKRCVNPAHLEPVAMRENILRSDSASAVNARKTHCIRGHRLPAPSVMNSRQERICRPCERIRRARRAAAA